jgi:predicted dehydrogenase
VDRALSSEAVDAVKPVRKIGLGLVGCGRISWAHLDAAVALSDEVALVAVADRHRDRAEVRAREFGARKAYESLGGLLHDAEVEAVVVALPHDEHCAAVLACLRSGKHVLVEKPIANTCEEADEMIQEAAVQDRTLMVGHCRRFYRAVETAKERLTEIGEIVSITHFLGVNMPAPPAGWWRSADRAGGLVVGLLGPHMIDTILWMVEKRPLRVFAETARARMDWEGEDEASITIGFEGGAIGSGHVSFGTSPPRNYRTIVGRKGTMHLVDDTNLWIGDELAVGEQYPHYLEGGDNFRAQLAEFIGAIRERRTPRVSGAEARTVVAVLEAARRSAREHIVVWLK